MHLKRIFITGLFGNRTFGWDLGDINIMGGKNGMGKSTILKCCYTLLTDGKITSESDLYRLVDTILIQYTNGWSVRWEKKYSAENEGGVVVFDENNLHVPFERLQELVRPYFVNSFEQYVSKAIEQASKMATVGRDANVTYLDTLIEDQRNVRNAMFAGTMEKIFQSIQIAPHDPAKIQEVLDQADVKVFMSLYPVIRSFFKEYGVTTSNDLVFERGGNSIPYTRLSMGEKQLLYVLLLAANSAVKPSILFMDEPDLGMHIDWKEMLIKQIRSIAPHTQIIMTTHAPSVIKGWQKCVKEFGQLVKPEV